MPQKETPVQVSVSQKYYAKVDILWSPSVDNGVMDGYYIYRNGILVGEVSSTPQSYTDKDVPYGLYSYAVAGYDKAGNLSRQSTPVNIMVVNLDSPPSPPASFSATLAYPDVRLVWSTSTDNAGDDASGYHIYRFLDYANSITSNTFVSQGNAFIDRNVPDGIYVYSIAAYDKNGSLSKRTGGIIINVASSTPISAAAYPVIPGGQPQASASTSSPAATPSIPPTTDNSSPSYSVSPPPLPTNSPGLAFTASMYYGARGAQVTRLQNFLLDREYLTGTAATGFYGKMTERAVKQFQCEYGIVCGGSPSATGWGLVGAKTRKALNSIY